MACFIFSTHLPCHSLLLPSRSGVYSGRRNRMVVSCSKSGVFIDEQCKPNRRDLLLHTLVSGLSFPIFTSNAFAESDVQGSFKTYEDETNKFRILVPQGWSVGLGDAKSFKSVTAIYPEGASDSNISIVITGVGPDFTSLKSYGSVDMFAESLVNRLDRSWVSPPGLAAKLIDCKASNGLYYVEYTLQNPGENRRHLYSVTGMAVNGWYNRLYTVTGQFMEDASEKYQSEIQKSVSSFRLI